MKAKQKKEPTWDAIGKAIGSKIDKGCDEGEIHCSTKSCSAGPGCGGAIYGLGFLGALVYFISTAPDFWGIIIGIIKSVFWPGVIVYGVLKFFGM